MNFLARALVNGSNWYLDWIHALLIGCALIKNNQGFQDGYSRILKEKQETRWTSKLTKKIKGIGKPETRTVLLIPTDTNPVKNLTKPRFKIVPKIV